MVDFSTEWSLDPSDDRTEEKYNALVAFRNMSHSWEHPHQAAKREETMHVPLRWVHHLEFRGIEERWRRPFHARRSPEPIVHHRRLFEIALVVAPPLALNNGGSNHRFRPSSFAVVAVSACSRDVPAKTATRPAKVPALAEIFLFWSKLVSHGQIEAARLFSV